MFSDDSGCDGHDEGSMRLEITFVCKQGNRDVVKEVTRTGSPSKDCLIKMKIETSAACKRTCETITCSSFEWMPKTCSLAGSPSQFRLRNKTASLIVF